MTSRIRRHHSNELSTIPKTDHHEMGIGRTRDHLYDPNQKSRTKNWKGELQLAFAIMISAVSFLVGRHTMIHDERSVQPPHGAAVRSAVTPSLHQIGEKGATTNICPSALKLFTNKTKLELAIESNIHFHQHGGNLHSIEQYLNSHMQSTLDRLGVQFTPGKSNNPVPDAIGHLNDYYRKNPVKRGGYGQPLPGSFYSASDHGRIFQQTFFEKRWINVLEPSTGDRFWAGIGPLGPECSQPVTFSKGSYEEKNICVEKKVDGYGEQRKDGDNTEECNIVSIGSNDQWGFEKEVMDHPKLRGCVTHTFDCTLRDNTPRNKPQNDNVKFYPYCIGSEGQQSPYLPFDQMWKFAKTKQAPKFLKMDVEGFEYDVVLNSILSSDPSIWPEQIMMEIHWATRMVDLEWMPRTRTAAELALFFGVLFNRGGYIVQHTHFNDGCQTCLEILLVRAVC